MTPVQKLKELILQKRIELDDLPTRAITAENVDALYAEQSGDLQDAMNEFRQGQFNTGLLSPYVRAYRDYESEEVAMQAPDGTWIGWTYWHGGGKHSDAQGIEWVENAYELNVTEKEQVVIVRTFTKPT